MHITLYQHIQDKSQSSSKDTQNQTKQKRNKKNKINEMGMALHLEQLDFMSPTLPIIMTCND